MPKRDASHDLLAGGRSVTEARLKVLVVDDHFEMAEMIGNPLSLLGVAMLEQMKLV